MTDYQRTIDNIRSILASAGPSSIDDISAVAAEYGDACEAVNDRLRKCGELLREGLRSEAIQQSETDPKLLNLVSILDFPEAPGWTALLQANGLPAPAPLLVEVAAHLNEAYAEEEPLAALLRQHRLMALARNPLRERISTLRKLAALDSNNPVWRDDLKTYEHARLQEIRNATDVEYKQGNVATLAEFTQDVQSGAWLEPPPTALVRQVCDAHARLVRQQARNELEQIEPQLNEAFSQLDVDRGQALRARWNTCAALADLADDDLLLERTSPALEWLDRQDQQAADESGYQTAVAELEQGLDDEESLSSLERRAHAVLRYERPIPPVLEQRYRTRVSGLELAKSRRMRVIIAAAFAAIVLVTLGIGYAVVSRRHEALVGAHTATLRSLLEKTQFDEAERHYDRLPSSIAGDREIQSLKIELVDRQKEENARRGRFLAAIEAAEKAGVDQPDGASTKEARELAQLDTEKARVLKHEKAIEAVARRRQAKRDEAFVRRLKEIQERIDGIDAKHPEQASIEAARRALKDLVAQSPTISPVVLNQSEIARARIDALSRTIQQRKDMQRSLAALDRKVGDVDGYKRSLEAFVQEFPESSQADGFSRVVAEAPLWEEIDVWNQFIETWQRADVAHLDAADAQELLAACQELLDKHGDYPAAAQLRSRITHLEAITQRSEEGSAGLSSLKELFSDPLVAGLWMVEATDEEGKPARYYLIVPPPKPSPQQRSIRVEYITDFTVNANKGKSIRADAIAYSGQAPQSLIAKEAMDELTQIDKELWEAAFFRIIQSINSKERLEPILKIMFLQRVVNVACNGSESLRSAFEDFRRRLDLIVIDPAVRWMDPENMDAVRQRALIADPLDNLPRLQEAGARAHRSLRDFGSPLSQKYEWVGWLDRDAAGDWQCRGIGRSPRDGQLYVALPATDEKAFLWVAAGHLQGGNPELDGTKLSAFVEGRPVFAVQSGVKSTVRE